MFCRTCRDLLGFSLGLGFGVAYTNQIAVGNVLHRVAGGAHLLVHLVATADAERRDKKNYNLKVVFVYFLETHSL